MGDFFDLNIVDNQYFGRWWSYHSSRISSILVQGRQLGASIHITMLIDVL